jgi:para-aminobenzoate synthetase component I
VIFSRFKWDNSTILELDRPSKAYIYFRHHRFNLLSGFPESYPIEAFRQQLQSIQLQQAVKRPVVFHFFYEYGLIEQGFSHLVQEDSPLAVEIEYQKTTKVGPRVARLKGLELKSLERPSWSEYKEAFNKIQHELLQGNCYQVNLTYPYDFMTEELLDPRDIADYFFARPGIAPYAHATSFGEGMILSNTPECLFHYQHNKLMTMPIKGTKKRDGRAIGEIWQEMLADTKEEGELIMITDLLKNDLNRLTVPKAKVKKLRAPLILPDIVHQYSLITLKIEQTVSLARTMEMLFPGGSITGAPKKRVMGIIGEVERFQRGIYCGSTLLMMKDKKIASINIRTASINIEDRIWRYGAGGGITLLSKVVDEFKEMEAKVSSFLTLLQQKNANR